MGISQLMANLAAVRFWCTLVEFSISPIDRAQSAHLSVLSVGGLEKPAIDRYPLISTYEQAINGISIAPN